MRLDRRALLYRLPRFIDLESGPFEMLDHPLGDLIPGTVAHLLFQESASNAVPRGPKFNAD